MERNFYTPETKRKLLAIINDMGRFKLRYQYSGWVGANPPNYPYKAYFFQSINHTANFACCLN